VTAHPEASFRLERLESPPAGVPLLTDDEPRAYWLLSNGGSWKVALGQKIGGVSPEVYAAKPGVLFVGLYHGCAAAVRSGDGSVVDRVKLIPGNMVYWVSRGDFVVAVGEVEIGVFEPGGKFLWRAALGDVIDELEFADGAFKLTDVSGETARFEARTGRIL
jgi:hypothetical protein